MTIVVAWELCWYRYEVDLGDEAAGARLVAQGSELDELADVDRLANASADERGELALTLARALAGPLHRAVRSRPPRERSTIYAR